MKKSPRITPITRGGFTATFDVVLVPKLLLGNAFAGEAPASRGGKLEFPEPRCVPKLELGNEAGLLNSGAIRFTVTKDGR